MILILKGIIIGIGKIIPGVSGSMLAISMGLYQKLLDSINNFFYNPKKNFVFLLKVVIGVVISIFLFSNIILGCLNKYYLITIFFFIGLIIGGMKDLKEKSSKKFKKYSILSFFIITIFGFINVNNQIDIQSQFLNILYFFFIGFVDAFTMVVPGISGTATLMMLGAYEKLMELYSNIFNISLLLQNIKSLGPYFLGLVIGVFITVKIINYLFKNYKGKTYSVILGFCWSTIFFMFIKCLDTFYTLIELIIGILFMLLGLLLTKKINHKFND